MGGRGGGRSIIHTGACNRGVPARLHITHVFILSPVMDPIKNVSNVGAFMNIRSMPYCTVQYAVQCVQCTSRDLVGAATFLPEPP